MPIIFIGLLFALSACFIWGLIFVIPGFLADFSAIEVVLGRYLAYGFFSTCLLFRKGFSIFGTFPLKVWGRALLFAFAANILYYAGIVVGLRFATAPVTVLIVGMAPVLITLYGNWHVREISYKDLVVPCLGIGFGVILVNITEVDWSFSSYSVQQYLFGLLGVLFSLVVWSWYAVQNARFLKRNTHYPSSQWATMIGVGTFFWALIFTIFFSLINKEVDLAKFTHLSYGTLRFVIGALVLGVLCSWFGCYLWNRASVYLPVSLMGPLLIFETLFGLLFVYLVDLRCPRLIECVGFLSMIGGILMSIYLFKKQHDLLALQDDDDEETQI